MSALQRLELLLAIRAVVLLRVHLDVVALDEQRAAEALAQRRRGDHGGVLVRPLLGVADLRARDLEDDGAGVELPSPRGTPRAPCSRTSRGCSSPGTVKPPASPRPMAM